jgi:hypothetical protein
MGEIRDAWEVLWGLLIEMWLSLWQWVGGWTAVGPVLFLLLLIGMAFASDSKQGKRNGRGRR